MGYSEKISTPRTTGRMKANQPSWDFSSLTRSVLLLSAAEVFPFTGAPYTKCSGYCFWYAAMLSCRALYPCRKLLLPSQTALRKVL